MFIQYSDIKYRNDELTREYDSLSEKYTEVEQQCNKLKMDNKKNQKILGHTYEELTQTKLELEQYKKMYEDL